jgi:hypothetical protein
MIDAGTLQTDENAFLGTPQYMAPEQATGKHGAIDFRADVFALGAIVYEMLAGVPAFRGATIPEIVFKVVYEEPEPLPAHVAAAIALAVHQAMAKQATARFASVGSFVEALTGNRITSAAAAVVAPSGAAAALAPTVDSTQVPRVDLAPEPAPSPSRPLARRVGLGVAAVVLAAGAASAAYLLLGRGGERTPHIDREIAESVAAQLPTGPEVMVQGRAYHVVRGRLGLRSDRAEPRKAVAERCARARGPPRGRSEGPGDRRVPGRGHRRQGRAPALSVVVVVGCIVFAGRRGVVARAERIDEIPKQRAAGAGGLARRALALGLREQPRERVVRIAAREAGGGIEAFIEQLRAPALRELLPLRVDAARRAHARESRLEIRQVDPPQLAGERALGPPPRGQRLHAARRRDRRGELVVELEPGEQRVLREHQLARHARRPVTRLPRLAPRELPVAEIVARRHARRVP